MPKLPASFGFRNSFNGKNAADKEMILDASRGPELCEMCDSKALYRVGRKGFCKVHRGAARDAGKRERMAYDYIGGLCEEKKKRRDDSERKRPALAGMRKEI